jgi:DNA-binding transcriptional LysR family regulator
MRGRDFFAFSAEQFCTDKLLLEKLTNHSSDLVIMGEPPADMSLITQPFMENPLIAIAHPDHPLLKNLSIIKSLKRCAIGESSVLLLCTVCQ